MKIFVADDDGGGILHVEQKTLSASIYTEARFGYAMVIRIIQISRLFVEFVDKVIRTCYLVMKGYAFHLLMFDQNLLYNWSYF